VQSTDMKIESSPNIVSNKSTFLKNFEIFFFENNFFLWLNVSQEENVI
jgi:hypothetical protein